MLRTQTAAKTETRNGPLVDLEFENDASELIALGLNDLKVCGRGSERKHKVVIGTDLEIYQRRLPDQEEVQSTLSPA